MALSVLTELTLLHIVLFHFHNHLEACYSTSLFYSVKNLRCLEVKKHSPRMCWLGSEPGFPARLSVRPEPTSIHTTGSGCLGARAPSALPHYRGIQNLVSSAPSCSCFCQPLPFPVPESPDSQETPHFPQTDRR